MIDVPHHGDHRGARFRLHGLRPAPLFQESIGIVDLGALADVAHFLDHDHCRFLIQHLVDGAMVPSFIIVLMTSAAFTDILWARSATLIVS
jgi:hypothetical protein